MCRYSYVLYLACSTSQLHHYALHTTSLWVCIRVAVMVKWCYLDYSSSKNEPLNNTVHLHSLSVCREVVYVWLLLIAVIYSLCLLMLLYCNTHNITTLSSYIVLEQCRKLVVIHRNYNKAIDGFAHHTQACFWQWFSNISHFKVDIISVMLAIDQQLLI